MKARNSSRFAWIGFFCALLAPAYASGSSSPVSPLGVGAPIPAVEIRTVEGRTVNLRSLLAGRPALLVFYRGGWCPYCNRHLADLQSVESELGALGVRVIAISPDRPEKLRETKAGQNLGYDLLSDSQARAIRAFGLAFQMQPERVTRYRRQYGIDIEADSGATHHLLPVPAVYLVNADGIVIYRHYNHDYRSRINGKEVLTRAKNLVE